MFNLSYGGLHTVISGGQHGTDLAGLVAASKFGLKTGGMAPKGYRTQYGDDASLKDFGLTESTSALYPPRTRSNVQSSDGTLILSEEMSSAGTILTIRFCIELSRPYHLIPLNENLGTDFCSNAVEFIVSNRIATLNVAGNHERDGTRGTSGSIFNMAYIVLHDILTELDGRDLLLR